MRRGLGSQREIRLGRVASRPYLESDVQRQPAYGDGTRIMLLEEELLC